MRKEAKEKEESKEETKILSPKVDVVFHMLFGEQKSERITKKLIEDVIGEKIETIELEKTPYLWGEHTEDKVGIIDVRATINKGSPIDIEMQIKDNKDIEKRMLYYWSKLYADQLKTGGRYEKLNRSIGIVFLNYEIERLKELPIHTKWQIREEKNHKYILTKDLELHIIELPKIREKMEEGELKKWILFLENPEGKETKEMAEREPEIKEAIKTLEDISNDEVKARIAELRQKYIMDREAELETAEYRKSQKIAKKLRAIGTTTEEIKEITGLTEEEIAELGDIKDEEQRMRIAELKQKHIMDREAELETAEDKGRKSGLQEGRKKGLEAGLQQGRKEAYNEKKSIAKKLKDKNIPIEDIIEITGLSKEEI